MGSKDSIRVIIKKPGDKVGTPTHIVPTLERLQEIVGGYIEYVTLAKGLVIICNEEGKILGLDPNFRIMDGFGNLLDNVVGPVIVAGVDGEELADVPINLHEWKQYLWKWGN